MKNFFAKVSSFFDSIGLGGARKLTKVLTLFGIACMVILNFKVAATLVTLVVMVYGVTAIVVDGNFDTARKWVKNLWNKIKSKFVKGSDEE